MIHSSELNFKQGKYDNLDGYYLNNTNLFVYSRNKLATENDMLISEWQGYKIYVCEDSGCFNLYIQNTLTNRRKKNSNGEQLSFSSYISNRN